MYHFKNDKYNSKNYTAWKNQLCDEDLSNEELVTDFYYSFKNFIEKKKNGNNWESFKFVEKTSRINLEEKLSRLFYNLK